MEIQKEAKPDVEVVKEKEADVALPGDEHNTIKTVRTGAPPKIETGLLIESVQGRMVMPLETKEQVEVKVRLSSWQKQKQRQRQRER